MEGVRRQKTSTMIIIPRQTPCVQSPNSPPLCLASLAVDDYGASMAVDDYGAHLKSVDEAQEHAELTSHTNLSESIEVVLALVYSPHGKYCRSKTDTDLHTKRTGHTEFIDKTLDIAKPIGLEVPKKAVALEDSVMAESSQSEEMVVPEVDKKNARGS